MLGNIYLSAASVQILHYIVWYRWGIFYSVVVYSVKEMFEHSHTVIKKIPCVIGTVITVLIGQTFIIGLLLNLCHIHVTSARGILTVYWVV